MKYALNLDVNSRILSVTFEKYAPKDAVKVDYLPEGNIADYKYINGEFVHDPLPVIEVEEKPSQLDRVESQIAYLAIMTGHSEILEV